MRTRYLRWVLIVSLGLPSIFEIAIIFHTESKKYILKMPIRWDWDRLNLMGLKPRRRLHRHFRKLFAGSGVSGFRGSSNIGDCLEQLKWAGIAMSTDSMCIYIFRRSLMQSHTEISLKQNEFTCSLLHGDSDRLLLNAHDSRKIFLRIPTNTVI